MVVRGDAVIEPRRLLELALEGDRVKAYTETGMSLDRVIQQAIWLAESGPSLGCADLAARVLAKRDAMAARRSVAPLADD